MKKIILAFLSLSILAFAVDYSSMSITDLQSLRGTVPTQDRAAFQSAMQSKMSTATADERTTMRQSKNCIAPGTANTYKKSKNR